MPIVTLLSDFGLKDPYVAEMKAVILGITPDARIVDVSHLIHKFDVRMAAFVLASTTPYFPNGTIHVAVVDPGVGTKRRPLIIKTERFFYVGPDNGILILAAEKDRIIQVRTIANPQFVLPKVSSTFHGRDVFAPVSAHLARGVPMGKFGPEVKDYKKPPFAKPVLESNERLIGKVLNIDDFGNLITNITSLDLAKSGIRSTKLLTMRLGDTLLRVRWCKTYGETKQSTLALIGSHGFLEIAVNQGNASEKLRVKAGDAVVVSQA